MLWSWWAAMGLVGLVIGFAAAWSQSAWRVFWKTIAAPVVLLASRLLWPETTRNTPLLVFTDFVILSLAALLGDYLLGLRLGRNDRAGYRHDKVGH